MKRLNLILLISSCFWLTGCVGGLWTGASMVYDRHNVAKNFNNYHILVKVTNALFPDKIFRGQGCYIDIAVLNGDVLIVGHLPTPELMELERSRLRPVRGYRHLYNEVTLGDQFSSNILDGWITAQIRGQIFADDSIDPSAFKILTSDGVVFLLGDVKPDEGEKVINIARQQKGVKKVVKLLRYYTYTTNKKMA